jgi:hypothetical protein
MYNAIDENLLESKNDLRKRRPFFWVRVPAPLDEVGEDGEGAGGEDWSLALSGR